MKNSTYMAPHDTLFKKFLTDPVTAQEFLKRYLPQELQPYCDLNSLKLQQGSFVDPELRAFHSDILWSLDTCLGAGYIYALIEHQSSPDKHMAFRLMRYAFGAMKSHLDAGNDQLPLVIPMLFYHGRQSPYPYQLNWLEEFSEPELARQLYSNDLPLIDVTAMPDDEIMRHRHTALLEFVQKHIRQRDLTELLDGLARLLSREYTDPEQASALGVYLLRSGYCADPQALIELLAERISSKEETAMMTAAEILEQAGMEKGLEKGLERGREEGRREMAQAMLNGGIELATVASISGIPAEQLTQMAQ